MDNDSCLNWPDRNSVQNPSCYIGLVSAGNRNMHYVDDWTQALAWIIIFQQNDLQGHFARSIFDFERFSLYIVLDIEYAFKQRLPRFFMVSTPKNSPPLFFPNDTFYFFLEKQNTYFILCFVMNLLWTYVFYVFRKLTRNIREPIRECLKVWFYHCKFYFMKNSLNNIFSKSDSNNFVNIKKIPTITKIIKK